MRVGLIDGIAIGRRSDRATADEDELVRRLRDGDEQAFVLLVQRHRVAMLRLARTFVASTAVAEEVVQDTWLAVVRGIDGFAGRSSFKTWLFQILVNRARSTGVREQRSVTIGDHNLDETYPVTDGQVEREGLLPERVLELLQRVRVRRALPVHLVDDDEAGEAEVFDHVPDQLVLDLDAVDGRHHEDDGVRDARGMQRDRAAMHARPQG